MMTSFVPLTQLGQPSSINSTPAKPKKLVCMFCEVELRTDSEYERHLNELHPGWAMLLLQKMGMRVARENG